MLLRPALLSLLLAGALLLATPTLAQDDEEREPPAEDGGGGEGDEGGEGGEGGGGGGGAGAPDSPAPAPAGPPAAAGSTLTVAQTQQASTIPLDAAAQEVEPSTSTTKESSSENATESATIASVTSLPTPIYRLTRSGETCILLMMDAVINFKYETKSKEMREKRLYVDYSEPDGECGDDEASLIIKLQYYTLKWSFSKTPGGDRWYVNEVELRYHRSASTIFENASESGDVTLSTRGPHGTTLFPTPVGKSFQCQEEYSLKFEDGGVDSAVLSLETIRMQPFMFKDDFGPAYECSPGGIPKFRSETAPIAVGSTLAVVVLLTVSGYGVYRYFKIKKVQYDTME